MPAGPTRIGVPSLNTVTDGLQIEDHRRTTFRSPFAAGERIDSPDTMSAPWEVLGTRPMLSDRFQRGTWKTSTCSPANRVTCPPMDPKYKFPA